jgi:hypothetical protein
VQAPRTEPEPPDRASPLLDVARRAITLGLSGLFTTNEVMRRALGDALPRDWVDFAVDQSERTRAEFMERLAGELARSLEALDLVEVAERLLSGRVIEINTRIQLHPKGKHGTGPSFRLAMVKGKDPK